MYYENPVLPGFHPDPTICRVGETFYLATSTFEYVPGVPVYRSRNLVDWEPLGHVLTRESQLDTSETPASGGIFAPTLRHRDGTFYLATTDTSGRGHFLVTAADPAGEWSDPVSIDAPGIDPDLFFDDGRCYFTYFTTDPDRGIEQAVLDPDTGALDEERTVWTGDQDPHAEAPHLYERDGTYYLVAAEGGTHTGHSVVVARGDDPTGPFTPAPDNPIVTHRTDFHNEIHATGHADLVTDSAGNWWLVCLGIRPHGGFPGWHHLGRETFLAPVTWRDGWPTVPDGRIPMATTADLPDGRATDRASSDRGPIECTDTTFSSGRGEEWYWRRSPDRDRYRFGEDGLVLRGAPATLDDPGTTFLCRRQTNFDCRIRAHVTFDPTPGTDEEAGLALVMDETHHYEVAMTRRNGQRVALVRIRIGDATDVLARRRVGETAVLGVDAETTEYAFSVDGDPVATARSKYLSTEVAGGFTGVMVGPYATGNGRECNRSARVSWFRYEPRSST